ncbi:MAG: nitrile hydratase subunit beta [Acidobacteria bacterium]|nr:nitrile hydratase subunit beta [Acidobacteriota bacterium]
MNGVHDMGGMDGFGPVEREDDEPVFHHPWEGRVFAIRAALRPKDRVPGWGSFRYDLERIPPADYLRMSYYERWFAISMDRLLRSGLVTRAELETGRPGPGPPGPTLRPGLVARRSGPGRLDADVPPRFRSGEDVRARNLHPPGHTRLPRYTRGKTGVVKRDNGVYALQDTDEAGQAIDRPPQHVYTVRFTARDLWGERASARDTVYVDLWEDYLEPA